MSKLNLPTLGDFLEKARVEAAKKELARLDPNRPPTEDELRYAHLMDVRHWTGPNGDGS